MRCSRAPRAAEACTCTWIIRCSAGNNHKREWQNQEIKVNHPKLAWRDRALAHSHGFRFGSNGAPFNRINRESRPFHFCFVPSPAAKLQSVVLVLASTVAKGAVSVNVLVGSTYRPRRQQIAQIWLIDSHLVWAFLTLMNRKVARPGFVAWQCAYVRKPCGLTSDLSDSTTGPISLRNICHRDIVSETVTAKLQRKCRTRAV